MAHPPDADGIDSAGASHSNIPLAGGVEATFTADSNTQTVTHFQFTDWLGTRRLQTDALGSPEEICSGGAFGDATYCTGEAATDRHFTGKERDPETSSVPGRNDGLDYFGASTTPATWADGSARIGTKTQKRCRIVTSIIRKA